MGDPQPAKIGDQSLGICKLKLLIELQPIGGHRPSQIILHKTASIEQGETRSEVSVAKLFGGLGQGICDSSILLGYMELKTYPKTELKGGWG